jgi:hypothetical protein
LSKVPDEIEAITDELLQDLVSKSDHVMVF